MQLERLKELNAELQSAARCQDSFTALVVWVSVVRFVRIPHNSEEKEKGTVILEAVVHGLFRNQPSSPEIRRTPGEAAETSSGRRPGIHWTAA